jgi:hypothetical protein
MPYKIREIEENDQWWSSISLEVISEVLPNEVIEKAIQQAGVGEKRRRCLPSRLVVWLCIAMHWFPREAIEAVLFKILKIPRLLSQQGYEVVAGKSAISMARSRLGAKVMVALFKQVCRPIATPETVGAFAFGYRLVALDSSMEDVSDTLSNSAYFGRSSGKYGDDAFPKLRACLLCECGTHVIFDAGVWDYHTSERRGCQRLLRSLSEEMLVMSDSGLYSYDLLVQIQCQQAQFLIRVPEQAKLNPVRRLSDGSYESYASPSNRSRLAKNEPILVRVLEYKIDDPTRPHHGKRQRLVTSLLDENRCPALELICLYHERWEIKLTIDELDTHLRLARHPFRSLHPVGVIQEFYGMLLAHFIIRLFIHRAALSHQLDSDRFSFTNAVHLIADALPSFQWLDPHLSALLWRSLIDDLLYFYLPQRAIRINPRVVKRKQVSKFDRKRQKHRLITQPTKPFSECLVLLPAA